MPLLAWLQGEDIVKGMCVLFRRLRAHVERARATPAIRLLDDLLQVMDSDLGDSEEARLFLAVEQMERAFAEGTSSGANIFRIAAEAIGEGGTVAPQEEEERRDEEGEAVERNTFVTEVAALVDSADDECLAKGAELQRKEVCCEAPPSLPASLVLRFFVTDSGWYWQDGLAPALME
jgi:uncharacterized protein YoaH (UPF0181 family)